MRLILDFIVADKMRNSTNPFFISPLQIRETEQVIPMQVDNPQPQTKHN